MNKRQLMLGNALSECSPEEIIEVIKDHFPQASVYLLEQALQVGRFA